MQFYKALEQAIMWGKKISRNGWNGKGMYVKRSTVYHESNSQDILVLRTPIGDFNTWVPSSTDLMADDWSTD